MLALEAWVGWAAQVPYEEAARGAALRLTRSPSMRAALGALALPRGGRVAAFGDSLTADALSWAEILRHAFQLVSTTRDVELVNLGISGDSTVHLISRFADVAVCDPDLLIILAGTNDARRHGSAARRMLLSDRQTKCNLLLLRELAREGTRARVAFVTPPPILEDRVCRSPALRDAVVTWFDADVARKAALVTALGDQVVDSRAVLKAPLERLLLADGLHLSLRGQERLAGWIVHCLAPTGGHGSTGR